MDGSGVGWGGGIRWSEYGYRTSGHVVDGSGGGGG